MPQAKKRRLLVRTVHGFDENYSSIVEAAGRCRTESINGGEEVLQELSHQCIDAVIRSRLRGTKRGFGLNERVLDQFVPTVRDDGVSACGGGLQMKLEADDI